MKGLRSAHWWLQDRHSDVNYSLENIINNIIIAMYGVRWVLEISGDHSAKYMVA